MHRIGTAGWSVPMGGAEQGSHLYRYSRIFSCAEINSSFYRPHRAATWARWTEETPSHFRFSIKAPKMITHEHRLRDTGPLLNAFFEQIQPMSKKAGPVLFQLPPSLSFEFGLAEDFLSLVRELHEGEIVLEPRHASWINASVDALFKRLRIARAAVDPHKGGSASAEPGGDTELKYYRLHGSPRIYYSNYEEDYLTALAARIKCSDNVWIIFDNTALSHAYSNALRLQMLIPSSDL
jgi:uncharacterized protein YecE (DUF72 family)